MVLIQQTRTQGVVSQVLVLEDKIILVSNDARISVLNSSLKTTSLHSFHSSDPAFGLVSLSLVALFFANKMAICSFKLPSFVVDLSIFDVFNVVDACHCDGHLLPTVAILYDPVMSNTTRLAVKRDTQAVVVVSVTTQTVLFRMLRLPYNCFKILTVPSPTQGLLIFSHNALIYCDSLGSCVANVNSFWAWEEQEGDENPIYAPETTSDYSHLAIDLNSATAMFITPDSLLVTTKQGQLLEVTLVGKDGTGSNFNRKKSGVQKIQIKVLGISILSSGENFGGCTIGCNFSEKKFQYSDPQYIFMTSITNDSHLVAIKHVKSASAFYNDDDDDLYGTSTELSTSYTLEIVGSIPNLSSLKAATISMPSSSFSLDDKNNLEIVALSGDDDDTSSGSLIVFNKSVRPHISSSFDFKDIKNIWSIDFQGTRWVVLGRLEDTIV